MRSVVIHSRTNFYFPCKQQSVTIAFLFILQTRSTVHKWQILQFELINNLSCFVITRTHVIHTNETNTLNLYKRYKKEINNLIDGTLLLSFLIPLIMYIESLLLMVIVLIIPLNVFFFFDFANRKTSSMQMMIFTMMWSQLPLVVIMQR